MLYIQILLSILGLYFNPGCGNAKSTEHLRPAQLVIDSASINSNYLIVRGTTIAANDLPENVQNYQWYILTIDKANKTTLKKISSPKPGVYPDNSLYQGKNWNFSIQEENNLSNYFIIGKKNGQLQEMDNVYMFNVSVNLSDLNKPVKFYFNYRTYYLKTMGERDYTREEKVSELTPHYVINNYQLNFISDTKKQVIIEMPSYIYDGKHELWVADIDGDAKPDIRSPIKNSTNGYDIALFLSSEASSKNLVKLVAHYKPCSC